MTSSEQTCTFAARVGHNLAESHTSHVLRRWIGKAPPSYRIDQISHVLLNIYFSIAVNCVMCVRGMVFDFRFDSVKGAILTNRSNTVLLMHASRTS